MLSSKRDLVKGARYSRSPRERASGVEAARPNRLKSASLAALASICCLGLAGCSLGLPQAQNDPTKFYVLSAPTAASHAPTADAPTVRLRPVEIASYLRARPMIVRRGENEVDIREFSRWGEPLEQGIARVLREELLARGVAGAVDVGSLRSGYASDPKFEISVRILSCEGAVDGGVNFHAAWEIVPSIPGGTPIRGEYHPKDLRWTPKNDATLAAALSRAVSGLGGQIAEALPNR